ncbi:MAG: hemolysin family protein [Oscillospiraceae bacterium]|nr:hemolysin family protein [Oscillospiraceae bacterium]
MNFISNSNLIEYILLVIFILFSAFFSASEAAFLTVNKIRLKNYEKEGNLKARLAVSITENFDEALSAILIGNNVVNIAASSVATVLMTRLFNSSGVIISTIVMTILILTFGEVLPKTIAKENSEKFVLKVAKPLKLFILITYPIVYLFIKLKNLVVKLSNSDNSKPSVTEQELKYIIESIEEEGVLEKQESEMVQSALEFDEKSAADILTPRVDMIAINIDDDIEKNKEIILSERYSRIPVYKDNVDNIIGILHTRDYLETLIENREIDLLKIIQPCYFIYGGKELSSLLNDFKRKKLHVAIVVDDYGGTLGMVTMEDLLEQIVGDIWDEDEEIEQKFITISSDMYEVRGDANLKELSEFLEYEDRNFDSNYTSLGGWVLEKFNRIPDVGESFIYNNFRIIVNEIEEQRITKLIIKKITNEDN